MTEKPFDEHDILRASIMLAIGIVLGVAYVVYLSQNSVVKLQKEFGMIIEQAKECSTNLEKDLAKLEACNQYVDNLLDFKTCTSARIKIAVLGRNNTIEVRADNQTIFIGPTSWFSNISTAEATIRVDKNQTITKQAPSGDTQLCACSLIPMNTVVNVSVSATVRNATPGEKSLDAKIDCEMPTDVYAKAQAQATDEPGHWHFNLTNCIPDWEDKDGNNNCKEKIAKARCGQETDRINKLGDEEVCREANTDPVIDDVGIVYCAKYGDHRIEFVQDIQKQLIREACSEQGRINRSSYETVMPGSHGWTMAESDCPDERYEND